MDVFSRPPPPQPATTVVPRSQPFFALRWDAPENAVRGYYNECCCGCTLGPGAKLPPHWLDGGDGWVTSHFVDIEPFSFALKNPGRHRCKYCSYVAEGEECCDKSECWCPLGKAPGKMIEHLRNQHSISTPPVRNWATRWTNTQGCCDAVCCWPCQASNQISASYGYENRINLFWLCAFYAGGPLSCCVAALRSRRAIARLNRINEGCCCTLAMACCCSPCSLAQSYREFSAAGMWPGGPCNDSPPVLLMNMTLPASHNAAPLQPPALAQAPVLVMPGIPMYGIESTQMSAFSPLLLPHPHT